MGKLQAIKLNSYPAGNHSDGNNLFLRVKPTGARSWVFRYKIAGKAIELGMGSLTIRSLAEARHLAIDMKRAVAAGKNPKTILAPKRETKTFADYAVELIESKRPGWRNAKHAQQWMNTLEQYAFPVLGSKPVASIAIDDVVLALRPLWNQKPETASRVRSRIDPRIAIHSCQCKEIPPPHK